MKRSLHKTTAFSLVELVLALGVAAFALTAILGILPAGLKTQQASVRQTTANGIISQIVADLGAAFRLPPGQQSKQFSLTGHWAAAATPDQVYFMTDGTFITGSTNQQTPPTNAVFRATVTYLKPPTETTSLADITVTWPAQVDPTTGVPEGKVETFAAINRQ
jgi:uncharacterized protein (TIGR02598 family)